MAMAIAQGGRRRRWPARRCAARRPMTEINVTPMVDVMLVLLIVFMVAAPLLTVGVPIDLPQTKAKELNTESKPITVSVTPVGDIYLGDQKVEIDSLADAISKQTVNGTDDRIYVRGDQTANYGAVMKVMGVLSAAGYAEDRADHGAGPAEMTEMTAGVTTSVIGHAAILIVALAGPTAARPLAARSGGLDLGRSGAARRRHQCSPGHDRKQGCQDRHAGGCRIAQTRELAGREDGQHRPGPGQAGGDRQASRRRWSPIPRPSPSRFRTKCRRRCRSSQGSYPPPPPPVSRPHPAPTPASIAAADRKLRRHGERSRRQRRADRRRAKPPQLQTRLSRHRPRMPPRSMFRQRQRPDAANPTIPRIPTRGWTGKIADQVPSSSIRWIRAVHHGDRRAADSGQGDAATRRFATQSIVDMLSAAMLKYFYRRIGAVHEGATAVVEVRLTRDGMVEGDPT